VNILVTGGAGFIGSHLAAQLLRRHNITVVDMFHPYYSPGRKRAQLEALRQAGSFRFYELDMRDEAACRRLFDNGAFDAVYHLAAVPGVTYSLSRPDEYIDHNVKATLNVLRSAGEAGVKHVLFASSSSVYGDRENVALTEEMANGQVISPYAATKVAGESLCHTYHYIYGYRVTVLRFFTVYGPWGRPDMAIAKFVREAMNGREIEVYGEHSARDYTYIDDITAGLEAALESPLDFGVFNLGGGRPVTMSELLEELRCRFPELKVVRKPQRMGDVKMTWADVTKANRLLGYAPKVSVSEGLSRTIAWAREHPEMV
jgi:UDP-glucuronate 4-epimerase